MGLEDFKNLAAGIQSLTLALGVLVGGGWALYRFLSVRTIQRAKAGLEKLLRELQDRRILKITFHPSFLVGSDNGDKFILLDLEISNIGSQPEMLSWQESAVAAVLVARDSKIRLVDTIKGESLKVLPVTYDVISPGNTKSFPFIFPIEHEGIYLLEAHLKGAIATSDQIKKDIEAAGIDKQVLISDWGGTTIFSAKDSERITLTAIEIENKKS